MNKHLSILFLFIFCLSSCKKSNELREVAVTNINLNETEVSVIAGQTITLTAEVLPTNATDRTVEWSSSDNKVATVDKGVVTAVTLGVAEISATSGGITAKCLVTVDPDNYLEEGVLNLYIEASGSLEFLAERIAAGQSFDVLRVHGNLNGNDLEAIASMVSIKELDLADADIVGGGTYDLEPNHFGKHDENYYNTVVLKYRDLVALEKVILPNSLEKVEYRAFYKTPVKEVVLPTDLKGLAEGAFENCESLSSITLPQGLEEIGQSVFQYCKSLKGEVVIPDGIKILPSGVFNDCIALEKVVLPEGLEQLGSHEDDLSFGRSSGIFEDCKSLKSVNLPSSLKVIKAKAFLSCESLTGDIVIPEGVTELEDNVLENCPKLTKITLPSKLEKIGNYALSGTTTNFIIPSTVKSLGDNAFYNDSPVTLHFQSADPAEIGFDFINNSNSQENIIYVPKGSLLKYQEATTFSEQLGMDIGYEMFGQLAEED